MGDAALLHFAEVSWPYAVVAAPGLWAAYVQHRRDKREDGRDRSDLVKIAQEAAGSVIQDLREEANRLRERLEAVEAELSDLRKEHAQMMANKDAKITMLEGEKRQLEAEIASLHRLLTRFGIPSPKRGEPYWEVAADGELTPRQSLSGGAQA